MSIDREKRLRDSDMVIALSGEKPLQEMVRADLDRPVEDWTEQDCRDWRDMGWRLPPGAGKNHRT